MLLGPVFHAELVTTARRARYYVIRFLYGLIILFQVYLSYQSNAWRFGDGRGQMRIGQMADFGASIFATFAILQAVVVILLTPALVGGTIADERQRKTLHYLLTSELNSVEIVLGKLAARLLHVGVLVAVGLPVVCLIGLFGGIDFELLLLSYAGTLTTVFFLATLSILVSVGSRRPREAISLLYTIELAWLVLPTLVVATMAFWPAPWPSIAPWVVPGLRWVAVSSPVYLTTPASWSVAGGPQAVGLEMMAVQLLCGLGFLILAAIRLRPASRNDGEGGRGWRARLAGKRHWLPRPECGDDAMLWKEKYVARTGALTKAVMTLVALGLIGLLIYLGFGSAVGAFDEVRRDGYGTVGPARSDLNEILRFTCTAIFVLWSLGVASGAASGLTSEREEDTWLTLTSTPMGGDEILRAKMIGPVWALRHLAYFQFTLWGLGGVAGAVHPLGLVASAAEFAVFTWFLTALGTFFSLRSKNSTRALAATIALLIFSNGGYLFCCIPFRLDTPAVIAGSTPAIVAVSLASYIDFRNTSSHQTSELIAGCILGVLAYAVAAAGLTAASFVGFDAVVDRPDRFRRAMSSEQLGIAYEPAKKPGTSGELA